MTAKTLMVLGSMSSAGKSLLVTGLCRLYARRGWRVLPFKAQNMSNNAAVCSGGEIGRAQAVQAFAAGVEPRVEMNPILLKPEADNRSQVVVRGQVWDTCTAREYYKRRSALWLAVTGCLDQIKEEADLVILEGAGSPAEVNLAPGDLVNLAAARYAQAPCLLAGDIDRGGVFAQLLGTLWLLEDDDRRLIRGLIVNKFRGDASLFADGVRILEERGGVPVIGVVPYLRDHGIADEDAQPLDEPGAAWQPGGREIAVIRVPHISNFDDFDALRFEPGVRLKYISRPSELGRPAAVILPGSKSTLNDLAWLEQTGLAEAIRVLAAENVSVVGMCGGFQMLGEEICDPGRIESSIEKMPGLGLLPVRTEFDAHKTTMRSRARVIASGGFWDALNGQTVFGYEIHMGQTRGADPLFEIFERENNPTEVIDGAASADRRVFGTYLHGLFDNDNLRRAWLSSLGITPTSKSFIEARAAAYDRLADHLEASLDIQKLDQIISAGLSG
jgi:adenosylcobyric acid synthase